MQRCRWASAARSSWDGCRSAASSYHPAAWLDISVSASGRLADRPRRKCFPAQVEEFFDPSGEGRLAEAAGNLLICGMLIPAEQFGAAPAAR